jgi:pimeloyl-ACP methyl ester carboxylesterase
VSAPNATDWIDPAPDWAAHRADRPHDQSHVEGLAVDGYPTSRLFWTLADEPAGLVLFVHGFGGHATSTWTDFLTLLLAEPRAAGYDLAFYGYQSKEQQAPWSASELAGFLRPLLVDPSAVANAYLPQAMPHRAAALSYDRTLICAHSLGAVVVRRALLTLAAPGPEGGQPPVPDEVLRRIRLLLFAPAHRGGRIISVVSGLLGSTPAAVLEPLLRYLWMSVDDLDPEKSDELTQLRDDSMAALQQADAKGTASNHLVADVVVHGKRDRVVRQTRFCRDPDMVRFEHCDHFGVCKPSLLFPRPFNLVRDRLG